MMYEFATYSPSSRIAISPYPRQTEELDRRTNEDSPDVYEYEQGNICKFLQREDEGEEVIWYALSKPVQRVESMACIWCGHDPLMMRLV